MEAKITHYDCNTLIRKKDINRKDPGIFIVESQKGAGKTTSFTLKMIKDYQEGRGQFFCVVRNKSEYNAYCHSFFNATAQRKFPKMEVKCKETKGEPCARIMINGETGGFIGALSVADKIKNTSGLYNHVIQILFDELQLESRAYLFDEVNKLLTVRDAIARGDGQYWRRVPVYCCCNTFDLLNPYYTYFGISDRLRAGTKFLRGEGWVLQHYENKALTESYWDDPFHQAIGKTKNADYAASGIYLHDNKAFIERPDGPFRYLATIKYSGKNYAIKYFYEAGFIFIDTSVDPDYPTKIALSASDFDREFMLLDANPIFMAQMRRYFNCGLMRFKNADCKSAMFAALSVRLY